MKGRYWSIPKRGGKSHIIALDFSTTVEGEDKSDAFETHKEKDQKPTNPYTAKPSIKCKDAIMIFFDIW